MVTVDVGLAYRDDTFGEWTEMARSYEQRKLNCNFTTAKVWKISFACSFFKFPANKQSVYEMSIYSGNP